MKKKILFLLFTLTFLFVSCTTVYIPTEVNVPMFRDEHKGTVGLSYSMGGAGMQAGYAFTKQLALIGDVSFLNQKTNDREDFLRYGELGIGYYKTLDRSKLVSFEVFAGTGFASARSKDVQYNITETGSYYKIFFQPDLGLSFGWIDMIFACKMSLIKFTSYSYARKQDPLIEGEPSGMGFEPVLTLRFGTPAFKIKYQLGISSVGIINGPAFGREVIVTSFGAVFLF